MKGIRIEAIEKQMDFETKYKLKPNILLLGPDTLRQLYIELEQECFKSLTDMDYKEIKQQLNGMSIIRTKEEHFEVAFYKEEQ